MSFRFLWSFIIFSALLFNSSFLYAQSSHPTSSSQPPQSGFYAVPKVKYVGPATLNVRNKPKTGTVVEKIRRGKEVKIYDETNGWSRISSEQQRWVSSEHLCTTANCADSSKWFYVPPAPKTKSSTSTRSASSSGYTGGCPCSSSSNCYGPRGGRYCITSGGNKRYR